jgi:L-fucose isomerase-like protein
MNADTKFGFIPISSSITQIPVEEIVSEILPSLHDLGGERFDENMINLPFPIFYLIATGGTEEKLLNLWNERKKLYANEPVILIAHPGNNSLPASLEILARLQQDGEKGKIVYADDNTSKNWKNDLEQLVIHKKVFHQLKKSKIGLFGEPSNWLVGSMPEFETVKNLWGPEVVKLDLAELMFMIPEIKDDQIEDAHYHFTSKAADTKEPSKKEIKNVVRVYCALKELIKKYSLDAVSVRCFDLVTDLKTTGCFALSKLNDEGLTAGCEGDLVSTLGMLWANYLTDQTVWMANPAQLDEANNAVLLAHCSVPVSMAENYKLRSHFESGIGVGIQAEMSKGKVTLLRLGGKHLDKIWVTNGEILESGASENLCRTQIKVKLHGSVKVNDLLETPLGNHLLLMRGSYSKDMTEWHDLFISR